MQILWKAQIGWDENVPVNSHETWIKYKNQLPFLNHIQFDRCIIVPNQIDLQLHGSSDASEKAYHKPHICIPQIMKESIIHL